MMIRKIGLVAMLASLAALPLLASCDSDTEATLTTAAVAFEADPAPTSVEAAAAIPSLVVSPFNQDGGAFGGVITVEAAIGTDPTSGSAVLSGTTTMADVSGPQTFADLMINTAGTGFTLTFTITNSAGASVVAETDPFDVVAGLASLSITQQPTTTGFSVAITPAITVNLLDSNLNLFDHSSPDVTVSLGTDPSSGAATLGGTLTVTPSAGTATFSDLTIDQAGLGYTLVFTVRGTITAESDPFVIAGPPTNVAFVQEPIGVEPNTAMNPSITVEIVDNNGTRLTSATNTVTMALAQDGAFGSTLGGTVTRAAVNGVATFDDLTLDNTGRGFVLEASATGLQPGETAPFNVAGAATQLVFTQQPVNQPAGVNMQPGVVVEIQDANGNLVSATDTISLGVSAGNLGGTAMVAAVGGVAVFDAFFVDSTQSGITLSASATGLTSATSSSFNTTDAPTAIAFTASPSNAGVGGILGPISVEVQNAAMATYTTAPVTVTLSLASGSGTLGGTLSRRTLLGEATFTDITLDTAGNGVVLQASIDVNGSAVTAMSNSFNVGTTATELRFVTGPANGTVRTNLANIEVEITDASGVRDTTATQDVTLVVGSYAHGTIFHASGLGTPVQERIDPITPNIYPALSFSQSSETFGVGWWEEMGMVITFDIDSEINLTDPETGEETLVADRGTHWPRDLRQPVYVPEQGAFFVTSPFEDLFGMVDPYTGVYRSLPDLTMNGLTVTGVNGLAYDPVSGNLYGAVKVSGQSNRRLGIINPETSIITDIGSLGDRVAGLACAVDGTLYAVTGDGGNTPETLFTVNTSTGAMTQVTALGNGNDGESITIVRPMLIGTVTVTAVNGLATFSGIQAEVPGAGYTIIASANGLASVESATFDIAP